MNLPPPPPPGAIFLLLILLLLAAAAPAHTCSPTTTRSYCPPFTTTPPFPFSSSPGCGHPSFQIQCSNPLATISINNISFSLLHYQPNSTSLFLSPHTNSTTANANANCTSSHSLSIPTRPVNLSNSPFRATDSFCSRLSFLRPCLPPNLPNCSRCPWECKLVKTPLQLIHTCGSTHTQVSKQGCQPDILGFLDKLLKMGIEMEFDDQDEYFSNCKDCKFRNGVCGFNSSDPKKPFICFGSANYFNQHVIRQNRVAIMSVAILCVCLLVVVLIGTYITRWRKRSSSLSAIEEDPAIIYLHRHRSASLLPPVFSFEELQSSTNNFDPKRKIGDGGFGSVYLGQLNNDRIFAIKYLHKHHPTTKSFCNEILILSSINHPNLVKLHGYCSDPRGLLLVYEYVPNGTLSDHLHGYKKGSLTWQLRIDVALQTAMAIEYLHCSVVPPIVHRDITSNNIFVDKDMRVKVGDFGMSRLMVCSETTSDCVWTGPQGTPGYLDPDYHKSFRLTEKSDIYSFGVVLLELITGMRAVDQRREKREMALADMAVARIQMGLLGEVVDPVLAAEGCGGGVGAVAELAFRCVAADKDDRPDAREVVAELRRIRGRTRGVVGPVRVSNSANVVIRDGIVGPPLMLN